MGAPIPCICPAKQETVDGMREEWQKFLDSTPHFEPNTIPDWWFAKTKESYKQGILEGMRMGRKCEEERKAKIYQGN